MKQIKLRDVNRMKFCIDCKEIVEIEMRNLDGFCSRCLEKDVRKKLFTLNPKTKDHK